jgi:ABC-type nitrate/sulfonate/bicarbonate transport system permease component
LTILATLIANQEDILPHLVDTASAAALGTAIAIVIAGLVGSLMPARLLPSFGQPTASCLDFLPIVPLIPILMMLLGVDWRLKIAASGAAALLPAIAAFLQQKPGDAWPELPARWLRIVAPAGIVGTLITEMAAPGTGIGSLLLAASARLEVPIVYGVALLAVAAILLLQMLGELPARSAERRRRKPALPRY